MGGGPPGFPPGFTCPMVLWILLCPPQFRLRVCHPLWYSFPAVSTIGSESSTQSATPEILLLQVWPLPISLAATLGIDVSYSSSPYLDVSVQEVPFHTLCIGVWIPLCGGFPHSEISGSMDICSSPKLFAAYHVFHRLSVPRHPPCALLRLTSSYACVCVWVFR